MNEIPDRACLQLGIGAMPNIVGNLIAKSDLKDLGIHTEMLVDSFVDMYDNGKITGKYKSIEDATAGVKARKRHKIFVSFSRLSRGAWLSWSERLVYTQ